MRTATTAVEAILKAAAEKALDYVASGSNRSAQICVEGLRQPVWVNVDVLKSGAFYAETNDRDFLVPIPPTFHETAKDSAELSEKISAFLSDRLADVDLATVRVFRSQAGHNEVILVGTSQTGKFEEYRPRVVI